ncbi:hypothetical protein CHS0354_034890 [Potamilus streckersoni]|uniref:Uncharacterized protein n=1 Tax=Potamilus streckersoni TaxID=2493646 RepID=A0AAE0S7J7_9BIVA|nr:hypothetical protein CHS0354_034890 [Potamilus streckersoni]
MSSSEPDSCTNNTLQPLRDLCKIEEDLLKYGRDAASASRDQFVNDKIGKFFGLSIAYRNCFERLKVKTKVECEKVIKDNFRHKQIREVFEEIIETEAQWDTFLQENDSSLKGDGGDTVQLDEFGPIDATLQDARTGNLTSLYQIAGQENLILILLRHFA